MATLRKFNFCLSNNLFGKTDKIDSVAGKSARKNRINLLGRLCAILAPLSVSFGVAVDASAQSASTLPVLSVEASVDSIFETSDARFEVIATVPEAASIPESVDFKYQLSQTGEFVLETGSLNVDRTGTFTFEKGSRKSSQTITVPLLDNNKIVKASGSVILTLLQDDANPETYVVNPSQSSAAVDILNTGTPAIVEVRTADDMNESVGEITAFLSPNLDHKLEAELVKNSEVNDKDLLDTNEVDYSVVRSVIKKIFLSDNSDAIQLPIAKPTNLSVPTISIQTDSKIVNEGEIAEFTVKSKTVLKSSATIEISLDEIGEFLIGPRLRQVEILKGQSSAVLSVATVDDNEHEEDGSITAILQERDGYKITNELDKVQATVGISDAADRLRHKQEVASANGQVNQTNQEELPVLSGLLSARLQEAANLRLAQAFTNTEQSIFEYNGPSSLAGVLSNDRSLNDEQNPMWDIMGKLSFSVDIFPDEGGKDLATTWGFGNFRQINDFGIDSSSSWDGRIYSGHYGIDTQINQNLEAGIMASVSDTNVLNDQNASNRVQYDSSTIGLFPYLNYSNTEQNVSLQATAGFGVGEVGIDSEITGTDSFDSEYYAIAASGIKQLSSHDNILGTPVELSLEGAAWMSSNLVEGEREEELQLNTSHYDLMLKATQHVPVSEESVLQPSIAVGISRDDKGKQKSNRLVLTGGAVYENTSGLAIESSGLVQISNEGQVRETGLQWNLNYDSNNDDLGAQLEFRSNWGFDSEIDDNKIWNSSELNGDEAELFANYTGIETEFAYGFKAVEGLWKITPYGGVQLKQNGPITLRIGNRLAIGNDLHFWVQGEEEFRSNGELVKEISIHGSTKW